MRVLVSGGIKTQNIVSAIEKKFRASGDEFIVVEYLEDINSVYSRGDYYDKAIIAEQSINKDGAIRDEYEIRSRINSFVIDSANRNRKVSFVFFTQDENMANMIHEEILPIISYSAVVLKKPPYFANFFTSIIVNDVGQIPSELLFKPQKITTVVDNTDTDSEDVLGDMDLDTDGMVIPHADTPIGDELFPDDGFGDDTQIQGIGDPDQLMPDDNIWDNPDNTNNQDFTGDDTLGGDTYVDDQGTDGFDPFADDTQGGWDNQGFTGDDTGIDMTTPDDLGARSGDIPDYTVPTMPLDDASSDGFIPGFDIEGSPDDDIYDPDTSMADDQMDIYKPNDGNDYAGEIPVNQDDGFDPLGQDLYGPDAVAGGQYGNMDQQTTDNQYMGTQDGVDPYGGMGDQYSGMDPYGNNNMQNGYMDDDIEATQTSNRQVGKRHKGIAGILGGNRIQSEPMPMGSTAIGSKDIRKVKDALKPFASRGNSIVVTGCGGCGTSTIAFNLANIIQQIGYTVLLVDMDTEGRSQGYISKACYDSMDVDGSNLMSAVNSSTNMNSNATVVKKGFHLLTMGLATDVQPIEEQLHKEKIARFVSVVKTGYNFVIYDVPFKHSVNFLSDITFMCDNLVLITDASNWGVTKTMLAVCNIESDDMQDTIFHRAQLVFNRYRNLNKLFGLKVRTCDDIVKAMDRKVLDLIGDDIGLQFSRMSIAGIVNDDPMYENGWYEDIQYSDTKKGQDVYIDLIESIVLKKH